MQESIQTDVATTDQTYLTVQGSEVPALGFGTYHLPDDQVYDAVSTALDVGYRHIDTAMGYDNEIDVGRAIDDSDVPREDLWVTTKLLGYREILFHDNMMDATRNRLEQLDLEYLDLLLIHWWDGASDMATVLEYMSELVEEGLVRNIGVSNFSLEELQEAVRVSPVPIFTNQIEYHTYLDRSEMLAFCRANDVLLTAYSPLGQGLVVDDAVLSEIGARYGKTAAQVAIRWLLQQEGVSTIPRSANPKHIRANFDVMDFELTRDEMRRIDELEGPLMYRLNREGGAIYELRGALGPVVPDFLRERLVSVGGRVASLVN
jgi:diketogulonate reductase-like aldo/keto reductase